VCQFSKKSERVFVVDLVWNDPLGRGVLRISVFACQYVAILFCDITKPKENDIVDIAHTVWQILIIGLHGKCK